MNAIDVLMEHTPIKHKIYVYNVWLTFCIVEMDSFKVFRTVKFFIYLLGFWNVDNLTNSNWEFCYNNPDNCVNGKCK